MAMNIAGSINELIGKTPLLKLNTLSEKTGAFIIGKLEAYNPGGSIKDRIGLYMIEDAEQKGLLDKDTVLIESTSGNTGIALAMIAAARGYTLIITMPESMSIERKKLLEAYGAEVILTPAHLGMRGSIEEAERQAKKYKKVYIPQQFTNRANPEIHRQTTAREIWEDTEGKVDIVVSGVGTGGTITGISEELKKNNSRIQSIAVEPFDSAVLSGGKPGPHRIQGIGAGFVPEVLNVSVIDEIVKVTNDQAYAMAHEVAHTEGLLCGISSGAALHAACEIGKREENKNKLIVVILPDSGERYISINEM